jgi:hypothetical protein
MGEKLWKSSLSLEKPLVGVELNLDQVGKVDDLGGALGPMLDFLHLALLIG